MSSAQMLASLENVTKVKRYFICCDNIFYLLRKDIVSVAIRHCGDVILKIKRYFIYCDIILKIICFDIILKINRYFIC